MASLCQLSQLGERLRRKLQSLHCVGRRSAHACCSIALTVTLTSFRVAVLVELAGADYTNIRTLGRRPAAVCCSELYRLLQ
jgi:hypothetical protein